MIVSMGYITFSQREALLRGVEFDPRTIKAIQQLDELIGEMRYRHKWETMIIEIDYQTTTRDLSTRFRVQLYER